MPQQNNNNKLSDKKLHFYDNCLYAMCFSTILFVLIWLIMMLFVNESKQEEYIAIIFIPAIIFFIGFASITWGMFYHMIKRKETGWIISFIICFFIVGGAIISLAFYFVKMRKEFKEGKGIYESELKGEQEGFIEKIAGMLSS